MEEAGGWREVKGGGGGLEEVGLGTEGLCKGKGWFGDRGLFECSKIVASMILIGWQALKAVLLPGQRM